MDYVLTSMPIIVLGFAPHLYVYERFLIYRRRAMRAKYEGTGRNITKSKQTLRDLRP